MAEITLLRWLQDMEFKESYLQAKREVVTQAISSLQQASSIAVTTLIDVMENGDKDSPRVSAARSVLELSFRALELEDIEERVKKLEEKLTG